MKICIINNWINNENWWIYKLFENYFSNGVELTKDYKNCDILLFSVFGDGEEYKHTNAKYRVFTSWETRFYIDIAQERMQYANFSLTYMPTNGINFRMPLWYSWIDWWNLNKTENYIQVCGQSNQFIGRNILSDDLVPSPNNINKTYDSKSVWERPGFCCTLVGNLELESYYIRNEIYNEITNKIEQVDGYGLAFNNRFEGNKIELLKNFKFNICYENSIHEGYVTEKLFDAKFAGCVPIYYGDPIYSKIDFNENCFLNRLDFNNNEDFINEIKKLNYNKNYFIDRSQEPLFKDNQIPKLDNLYERFDEFFKN